MKIWLVLMLLPLWVATSGLCQAQVKPESRTQQMEIQRDREQLRALLEQRRQVEAMQRRLEEGQPNAAYKKGPGRLMK